MRLAKGLIVGWLATATLLLGMPSAFAAPPQDSFAEVIKALNVSRQPSDYVLVVDTSGSMKQDNRYGKVLAALRSLLTALQADDRVSLVTFDTRAQVRFRGVIGKDRYAALRQLPPTPEGALTDIGAGIDAGIDQLEAADAKQVGAIVLITDGKLDTSKDSRYRKANSAAWKNLRTRADKVAAQHQIASYAIALESKADAALLKKAFPKAEDIPARAIDERLAELDSSVLRFLAQQVLEPEGARGVEISWPTNLDALTASAGPVSVPVKLKSTYEHVPVEVSALELGSTGFTVNASGAPATLTLEPGAEQTVELKVTSSGEGNGLLRLTGTVASPWQRVITKTLGLPFNERIEGSAAVAPAPAPAFVAQAPSWLPIALLGSGAVALVVLVGLLLWRATRPRMVGSLAITRAGSVLGEFLLAGRSVRLDQGTAGIALLTGSVHGAVKPAADKGKQRGVTIKARSGTAKAGGTLWDGESLVLGDLRITYTSARSRMIDLINQS